MELNTEQKVAVEDNEHINVLVLAPPGSGKTRVIVERTAYLIEKKKVSPYEILLVTFTRKAAGEMRERLKERIGSQADNLTIGTFHATALKLLHQFGDLIGFKKNNSTVYGDWEERYLLKEVAMDLGYHTGKTWKKIKKKEVDAVFQKYYQEGIEPDRFKPGYAIFKAFIQRCRENNSYTYGSLLTGLKLLLPEIHQYLNWKHIITDESQDTDRLQWELIRTMQRFCNTTLFSVADPDQAIYEWRGADADYLVRHQSEFTVYELRINYRSDENIVGAANKLIQYNQNRIPKNMVAFEDAQTPVELLMNRQSADLVFLIKKLNEKGPEAIRSVLARNHVLLRKLSQLLSEQSIRHVYIGQKTALTNSEEFRRFHAFLKLIVNPFDNFSFLLIRDLINLTRTEYNEIREKAVLEGLSHFQAWMKNADCVFSSFFWGMTDDYNNLVGPLSTSAFGIKYMATGAAPYPGKGWSWNSEKVEEIFKFIFSWLSDHHIRIGDDIGEYLNWLATYDIQEEIQEGTKDLQLMTVHAAKGLEWPTVIIAGANEGIIPSAQAIKANDLEAERRLMYVAITRAQDKLIITSRPEITETESGKVYVNPVSRFLNEMGLSELEIKLLTRKKGCQHDPRSKSNI